MGLVLSITIALLCIALLVIINNKEPAKFSYFFGGTSIDDKYSAMKNRLSVEESIASNCYNSINENLKKIRNLSNKIKCGIFNEEEYQQALRKYELSNTADIIDGEFLRKSSLSISAIKSGEPRKYDFINKVEQSVLKKVDDIKYKYLGSSNKHAKIRHNIKLLTSDLSQSFSKASVKHCTNKEAVEAFDECILNSIIFLADHTYKLYDGGIDKYSEVDVIKIEREAREEVNASRS